MFPSGSGVLVTKSCPTLGTPLTEASQLLCPSKEYWSGLPFPSPGGPSQPRNRTHVSALQVIS